MVWTALSHRHGWWSSQYTDAPSQTRPDVQATRTRVSQHVNAKSTYLPYTTIEALNPFRKSMMSVRGAFSYTKV